MSALFCASNKLWRPLHGLFIYLLLSQGLYVGLVLCVEANGRLQIEPTHMTSPADAPSESQHGPCRDLSLTDSTLMMAQHTIASPLNPAWQIRAGVFLAFFLPPNPSADRISSSLLRHLGPTVNTPTAFLRTSILII
jgi:hypothetical protein